MQKLRVFAINFYPAAKVSDLGRRKGDLFLGICYSPRFPPILIIFACDEPIGMLTISRTVVITSHVSNWCVFHILTNENSQRLAPCGYCSKDLTTFDNTSSIYVCIFITGSCLNRVCVVVT